MKKLFTPLLLALCLCGLFSCSLNDDGIYVSSSGEGSITLDYDSPILLSRMVLLSSDSEQLIYLMGNTAYIDADANFNGRGAVVKFTIPNTDDNSTILAQTFDVSDSDYSVSYSTYVNYSASEGEDDFVSLDSGTVIIRKSGSYYDIRLLGIDADENNVLIAYRGYIYRSLIDYDEGAR